VWLAQLLHIELELALQHQRFLDMKSISMPSPKTFLG
jgi:hypothetical protein